MLSIVTDSAAALPPDMPADLPIRVVPFTISLGEETFLDGVDIKPVEFYARLRTGGPFPMTSQPSPGAYLTVFQELLSSGPVLCLTLSSALSGSFESARQAKAHLGDPPGLAVVDTGTAAACQGVLALIAARAASRGETLAAVLARVEDLRDRVEMLGVLADLHYLARGGRIGRAAAWAGSVIRIHPIVGVRDGVVAPVERVRTRRRALEVMAERLAVAARTWTGPVGIALMHTGEEDEAGTLRELVTARLEKAPAEAWTTTFPPVLGAHTGPGLVGAAIWPIPSDLA